MATSSEVVVDKAGPEGAGEDKGSTRTRSAGKGAKAVGIGVVLAALYGLMWASYATGFAYVRTELSTIVGVAESDAVGYQRQHGGGAVSPAPTLRVQLLGRASNGPRGDPCVLCPIITSDVGNKAPFRVECAFGSPHYPLWVKLVSFRASGEGETTEGHVTSEWFEVNSGALHGYSRSHTLMVGPEQGEGFDFFAPSNVTIRMSILWRRFEDGRAQEADYDLVLPVERRVSKGLEFRTFLHEGMESVG